MLHGLISYPGLTMNQVPTTRFLFSHKNLDRQTSLFPEPLCLPSETFNLSSLDPQDQPRVLRTGLRIRGNMSNPRPLEEVGWVQFGGEGWEHLDREKVRSLMLQR